MSDMNHYLYIEPYSFLFKKGEKAGLYNTIDGVMTKIIIPKEIDTIVSELADKKVVKLPFESLEDMDLKNFLTCLKQSFIVLIAMFEAVSPAFFPPIPSATTAILPKFPMYEYFFGEYSQFCSLMLLQ